MRHNIECYEFNFDEGASVTKITIISGDHPIKPCLAIFDNLGKRIIPFEFCTQYLDRFSHQKKFNDVCAKFKEVSANHASTITSKVTLLSSLAELPQPLQDSAFPQLGLDQTYVHLAVDFDNPWFDESGRRALVEKVVLTPAQASSIEKQKFRELLSDTALPLMLEGYQVSGFSEKQRRIIGSNYDGRLSSELPRYQFHQKHINVDTANIITSENKISIGFCSAVSDDKLSNRLVAHIFQTEAASTPDPIDFKGNVDSGLITRAYSKLPSSAMFTGAVKPLDAKVPMGKHPFDPIESMLLSKKSMLYPVQVSGIDFFVENDGARQALESVIPRIFQPRRFPETVQTVAQLTRAGVELSQIKLYAYDVNKVAQDAAGLTYFHGDGFREILLQTQNRQGLLLEAIHEWSHATLPLAMPYIENSRLYQSYAPNMRSALFSDYWDYNKTRDTLVPIQKKIADWVFHCPQSYPKGERLAERLAFAIQGMAESDMVARSVMPRFYNVVKEYVAEQARLPVPTGIGKFSTPSYPAIGQPIKIWDVTASLPNYSAKCGLAYQACPYNFVGQLRPQTYHNPKTPQLGLYTPNIEEVATMPWRPGITRGRRLPWYQRPNYNAIGRFLGKVTAPPLIAWDVYSRMKHEHSQFPGYSNTAHNTAIATDFVIDYGSFALLAGATSASVAMGVLMPINLMCHIANEIRDISINAVENNRNVFFSYVMSLELSGKHEMEMMKAFDRGEQWTRELNRNAVFVTKVSCKPFEWLYDAKKGVVDFSRIVGDFLSRPILSTADNALFKISVNETGSPLPWGASNVSFNFNYNRSMPQSNSVPYYSFNSSGSFVTAEGIEHSIQLPGSGSIPWQSIGFQHDKLGISFNFSTHQNTKDPFYFQSPFQFGFSSRPILGTGSANKKSSPFFLPVEEQRPNSNIPSLQRGMSTSDSDPTDENMVAFAQNIDAVLLHQGATGASHGLSEMFRGVNARPSELQSVPQMPSNLMPQHINHCGISLVENTSDMLMFRIDTNSAILSPEFHSFLTELNQLSSISAQQPLELNLDAVPQVSLIKPEQQSNSRAGSKESEATQPKPKEPLITDIKIGAVGGGVGVIASLAGKGAVSFTAGKGSFFISVSASFGPGFWTALGTAAGVGAVIAGVMITAQHFYKKHIKHIQNKLTSAIDHTKKDAQFISEALSNFSQKLQSENGVDLSQFISETQALISHITQKIYKEEERADYARRHKKPEASNAHNSISRDYQSSVQDLSQLKKNLELDQVQTKFVETNQGKTSKEIIGIAKELTSKTSYNDEDIAKIKGLRQLIVSKVLQLSQGGKTEEAQALLKETFNLQYRLPGNIAGLILGSGMGKVDENSQGDINKINKELNNINQLIGSGGDPVVALQGLITHISGVLNNWNERKAERHEIKKKSSSYVSCQQWDARIRALNDLVTNLQSQIKQYEEGNQAADLKLDGLCIFLQKLSSHSEKPIAFWVDELKDLNGGGKSYSEEESILLKAISSHHLINSAVTKASQGDFEEAKHIMSDLMELIPEYKELSEQYNAKLDELKPFVKEGASFWLNRIKSINTIAEEQRKEADGLELVIAEQFTLNDVFVQAAQGQFDDAKKILEEFMVVMPDQKETVTTLITKIEELQPHYQDVDYCLRILKAGSEKPADKRGIDDMLENAVVNQVIMRDIFSNAIEGEFSKAKARCDEYLEASPDKIKKIEEYKAGVEELEALKGKNNKTLLERYAALSQTKSGDRTGKEDILAAGVHAWIVQNVFELVSNGKPTEAIDDLNTLKRADPNQGKLCDKLTSVINHGQENSEKSETFWHEEYKKYLQTNNKSQSTGHDDVDAHAAVNSMGKTVAAKAIFDIASGRSQLGFNREARDVIKRLRATDPSLKLQDIEDDFDFAHQGQVLSIFTKPLQEALVRHVRSWQPSKGRSLALGGLELANTVQVIVPNALSLAAQAAHAKCVIGNMCVVKRNAGNVWTQLSKDINPFDKNFNPFNKESYCNGAMIYGQLLLKAAQHFPLDWVVSEQNLLSAEGMRNNVVWYGNLATRSVITGTATLQLKAAMSLKNGLFSAAYTPLLLVTLANTAVDLSYWGYHKYKDSRGESIEDPGHYIVKEGVGAGIETLGAVAFAGLITGGLGWLALGAGVVVGGVGIHNVTCNSTQKETTARALIAAITNIGYYRNLKTAKQYVDSCKYKLIRREANDHDIEKVKSRSEIILADVNGDYYIYYASEEHDAYHKRQINVHNAFLRQLDWPEVNHSGIFLNEGYAYYMMSDLGHPDHNELEKGMYFYGKENEETVRVLVVHGNGQVDSPDLLTYFKEFKRPEGESTDKYRPITISAELAKFITARCDNAPKSLQRIKEIIEAKVISTPIISEYTSKCTYRVSSGRPGYGIINQVQEGKEICFTKELHDNESRFFIYIKGKNRQFERIQVVARLRCFEDIKKQGDSYIALFGSKHFREVYEYATQCVIEHYLMDSRNTIEKLLDKVFDGLTYDKNQLEAANVARIVHLYQKVKDFYDLKNYEAVVQWSNKFDRNGNIVISQTYQVPPHLAWQILVGFRFLAYAESKDLLLQFREQFQEYSKYIYDSANSSKPWYYANWEDVQKSMKQILRFALQQFIVAADSAGTKEEKLNYLSHVTQQYNYSKEWYKLLRNDELKFWAACMYHNLGEKKKCELFLNHIPDLSALIRSKRQADFTGHALVMLEDIDAIQHRRLLLQEQRDAFAIQDAMILGSVFNLLAAHKYDEANRILQGARDFQGKQTALAAYTFESTNQTRLLEALKQLSQEEDKTLAYWQLLYSMLKKCLFSTKYSPLQGYQIHANAMLFGLIKICADYIQTFDIIPWTLKLETGVMIDKAMIYIKNFVRTTHPRMTSDDELNVKVDELIQKGHKCIRGELGLSVITEIENILSGISYEYVEEHLKAKYMPLEVPADGDCAFHVFGISRKEGIDLLLSHVKSRNWISKAIYGNTQRKDVVNLILDDLEIANNTVYERSEEQFPENVKIVEKYLESLAKERTWMPYNQKASSVLDALALLLEKNLRIFVANSEGQLVLTSSNIHDEAFDTIDMLCTSANGFSHDECEFNHYIRLVKLPTRVVEVVERPLVERQQPQTLFFKYNPDAKPSKSSLSSENHAKENRSKQKVSFNMASNTTLFFAKADSSWGNDKPHNGKFGKEYTKTVDHETAWQRHVK